MAEQTPKQTRSKSGFEFPEENPELILRAQEGSREAMEEVIKAYDYLARGFVRKFYGSQFYGREDLEDLYQDACMSIMKAVGIYGRTDADGNVYPFWRTIWFIIRSDARVKRTQKVRRETNEVYGDDQDDKQYGTTLSKVISEDSIETMEKRERYAQAWEYATELLPPNHLTIWRLYYGRDMRESEIARELDVSRQLINVRLKQARNIVRKAFLNEGYRIEK